MDLSLHATAVPDSFVVRAVTTGGSLNAVPNAAFTVRWERSAGGTITDHELYAIGNQYTLSVDDDPVDVRDHRYVTVILFGVNNMLARPLTNVPQDIGSIRLSGAAACHRIALVNDGYTATHNADYYFAMGGVDVTGVLGEQPAPATSCTSCTPPTIIGVGADQLPGCGRGTVHLDATAVGSGLVFTWTDPDRNRVHYLPQASLNDAQPGMYRLSVSNSCGIAHDSVEVTVDPFFCEAPDIHSVHLLGSGAGRQIIITARGTCMQYKWTLPNATVATTTRGWMTLSGPPAGAYTVVALNGCGSDTIRFMADTLGACYTPLITAATATVPPHCAGDTAVLRATVTATGPYVVRWSLPNGAVIGEGAELRYPGAPEGWYTVRAVDACGNALRQAELTVDTALAGPCTPPTIVQAMAAPFCVGDTIELTAALASSDPCAVFQWSGPGLLNAVGAHVRAEGAGGAYMLRVTNFCGTDSVAFVAEPFLLQRSTLRTCGNLAMIDLDTVVAVSGGTWWTDGLQQASIFVPGVSTWGTYLHRPAGSSCPDHELLVEEGEQRSWYNDADGDGLGDPLDVIIACEQPDGYIATAGDDCPLVYGTIGDPCDSGDPEIPYAELNDDCVCEEAVGVDELRGGPAVRLWPNPNNGEGFRIGLPVGAGAVTVLVHDAAGRVLLQRELGTVQEEALLRFAQPPAPGAYVVRVITGIGTRSLQLVVH